MARKKMFCAHCGNTDLSVYYPTPEAVGRIVIDQADMASGSLKVLEPSAGTGNLARLAAEAGATVDCIELQGHFAEQLRTSGLYSEVWHGDFLSREPIPRYDRVIMNPPFERGADMEHVERAIEWLKPGGVLVAVMSSMAGKRRGRKDKAFATVLDRYLASETRLPHGAFAEVGTNVSCVLVRLEKAA